MFYPIYNIGYKNNHIEILNYIDIDSNNVSIVLKLVHIDNSTYIHTCIYA